MEPNPQFWPDLRSKNRNAWILPHCLSISRKVEIVEFYASEYIGKVIENGHKNNFLNEDDPTRIKVSYTEWKVLNFPVTQILREINYGEFASSKIAIYTILRALNFVNSKSTKIHKIKIQNL